MPSQIVRLEPLAFASLLALPEARRQMAFAKHHLVAIPGHDSEGRALVRIHVDPRDLLPSGEAPFLRDLFVLLLTYDRLDPFIAIPRPLPDQIVCRLLEGLRDALSELADSAHDMLALVSPVQLAFAAVPLPHLRLARRFGLPARIQDEVDRLAAAFAPQLTVLDARLDTYRQKIADTHLGESVVRLGLQHRLALELGSIVKDPGGQEASTLEPVRIKSRATLRATRNLLEAAQALHQLLHDHEVTAENWLTQGSILHLQRLRLNDLPGCERIDAMRTGADTWLAQFADHYDADRWDGLPAIFRAGLAYLDWLRGSPLRTGNRRVGELVMNGMLRESGLPLLPLENIIENDSDWESDIAMARFGDPQVLIARLIECISRAISLAEAWLPTLLGNRQALASSIAVALPGSPDAPILDGALSTVFGIDAGTAESGWHAALLAEQFNRLPELERVENRQCLTVHGGELPVVHMNPVARSLAAMTAPA